MFLPGKTDKAIAVKIQEAVTRIVNDPATEKLLRGQGLDAIGNTQDEFAKLYAAEINTWSKVVQTVGMKPN